MIRSTRFPAVSHRQTCGSENRTYDENVKGHQRKTSQSYLLVCQPPAENCSVFVLFLPFFLSVLLCCCLQPVQLAVNLALTYLSLCSSSSSVRYRKMSRHSCSSRSISHVSHIYRRALGRRITSCSVARAHLRQIEHNAATRWPPVASVRGRTGNGGRTDFAAEIREPWKLQCATVWKRLECLWDVIYTVVCVFCFVME